MRDLIDEALDDGPSVYDRLGALEVRLSELEAASPSSASYDAGPDLKASGDGGHSFVGLRGSLEAIASVDDGNHTSVSSALRDFLGDGEASVSECALGLGVSASAIEGEIGNGFVMDGGLVRVG